MSARKAGERRLVSFNVYRTRRSPEGELTRALVNYSGEVEITVDIDTIARIVGERALLSKTGRARACHGAVIVKVRSKTRVEK